MRFNASRFCSTATLQFIAASFQGGGIIAPVRQGVDGTGTRLLPDADTGRRIAGVEMTGQCRGQFTFFAREAAAHQGMTQAERK
jgi:hypothetical protein